MLATSVQQNFTKLTLKPLKNDDTQPHTGDIDSNRKNQNNANNVNNVKNDDVIITSGSENIITISSTCEEYNEIKSPKTPKQTTGITTTRIVNFLTKQPINNPSTHEDSSIIAIEITKGKNCCKLSDFISSQENIADVHHRKGRRLHGLQLPLHPLQIFGWFVLVIFGLAAYLLIIPSFVVDIQGPLYGLITGLYIVHIISHLAALLIDPADRELRRLHRNDRIVPEFDRTKHTHVIENGRCHLCNIRTSTSRTKHCSVCNKCVGKFDHHCKWLNHCIGSRNYVAFLMCVVSAVIATLVIVASVIAQITFYYLQPEWLSHFWYDANRTVVNGTAESPTDVGVLSEDGTVAFVIKTDFDGSNLTNSTIWNATNISSLPFDEADYAITLPTLWENVTALIGDSLNETFATNSISDETVESTTATTVVNANNTIDAINNINVSDTIFLVLIGFLGLLAAITAGLLLHLCFFHIYISFLGLTTYEYIRNHRQAQETKAKSILSALPNQQLTATTKSPSKKTTDQSQIYFCASLRHPNSLEPGEMRFFETYKTQSQDNSEFPKLHCCANSREYNQSAAVKSYYMCSLLEEHPSPISISHISGASEDSNIEQGFKTFHCCSSFAAAASQRKVSAASTKATLVNADTSASRRTYTQFTEQCTFCTFRIRSPIARRRNVSSAAASTRTCSSRASKISLSASNAAEIKNENERCCMKSISKHQRWRKKWSCCSNVPDSPDVPNDIIAALAMRQQQNSTTSSQKINATEIPVHFIKTVNGSESCEKNIPSQQRASVIRNNARTWPVTRFRHMLRMLNRQRRPHPTTCRHHNAGQTQIKQNQIRPLQLHSSTDAANGGCHHHHHHHHNHHHQYSQYQHPQENYYDDSSSPQPPSSTTTERSSEPSLYSDSSALTTPISSQGCNAIETILPTSVIRDDTSVTYTITLPPALPPPTRRKMPNPTDLEELAESLGFSTSHHHHHQSGTLSPATQRLPTLNNAYRRQRRKHFLRTRSPTLSPIHESGLSNPTSPQPCRHNTNCTTNTAGSMTTVNNICGSSETVRKTSSNSSLHSVSSNSSGT